MMVAPQVIIVGEDHRFDVAGDAQHAVLFETQERLLIFTTAFTPDSIVEVNLELGPSGYHVQAIDFFTKRLRILIAFLKMSGSQANQVDLKRHSLPLLRS